MTTCHPELVLMDSEEFLIVCPNIDEQHVTKAYYLRIIELASYVSRKALILNFLTKLAQGDRRGALEIIESLAVEEALVAILTEILGLHGLAPMVIASGLEILLRHNLLPGGK